jgi:hypothetical protein
MRKGREAKTRSRAWVFAASIDIMGGAAMRSPVKKGWRMQDAGCVPESQLRGFVEGQSRGFRD